MGGNLQLLDLELALSKQVRPLIQMLASSGVFAIRSMDSNSSPNIMEKAHSSGYTPRISLLRRASVVFPCLTSLIDDTATKTKKKKKKTVISKHKKCKYNSLAHTAVEQMIFLITCVLGDANIT